MAFRAMYHGCKISVKYDTKTFQNLNHNVQILLKNRFYATPRNVSCLSRHIRQCSSFVGKETKIGEYHGKFRSRNVKILFDTSTFKDILVHIPSTDIVAVTSCLSSMTLTKIKRLISENRLKLNNCVVSGYSEQIYVGDILELETPLKDGTVNLLKYEIKNAFLSGNSPHVIARKYVTKKVHEG